MGHTSNIVHLWTENEFQCHIKVGLMMSSEKYINEKLISNSNDYLRVYKFANWCPHAYTYT